MQKHALKILIGLATVFVVDLLLIWFLTGDLGTPSLLVFLSSFAVSGFCWLLFYAGERAIEGGEMIFISALVVVLLAVLTSAGLGRTQAFVVAFQITAPVIVAAGAAKLDVLINSN